MSATEILAQARSIIAHGDNATYPARSAAQHVRSIMQKLVDETEALEKKVYIPGQWRCPKCNFRLTQSNLYVASGTVGPRDEAGDKCPNCNRPLWRVSAMQDRNEAYQCANDTFKRVERLSKALKTACEHIDHMAAWITKQNAGYVLESLGEDMPDIRAALASAGVTAPADDRTPISREPSPASPRAEEKEPKFGSGEPDYGEDVLGERPPKRSK